MEQSKTRAATKIRYAEQSSGQGEIFESLHDMAPDELTSFLAAQCKDAEGTLLQLSPTAPDSILYQALWPQVLARHVVRLPDVNRIAADLRKRKQLIMPNWEQGKRVPQSHYKVQRSSASRSFL
jgi:hypothetical protein